MDLKQDLNLGELHCTEEMSLQRRDSVSNFWTRHFPKLEVFHRLSQFLILLFAATLLYSLLGSQALPGSEIFALLFLYLLACIGGKLVGFICLPPLLGMLIAGFLFRNLPFIPFFKDISVRWASTLRGSALVVILLKAGLGLDAQKLKQLKAVVLQLAFTPCIVETITIGITSHFFLHLPWMWGMLLGFVISAVSPAVVVPSLLSLQERKFGTRQGIPTLVIAAASVDDILAITGFTIMLSISVSQGSWIWSLGKGILEPLTGFIFGMAFGSVLWYVPSPKSPKVILIRHRVLLLCVGGMAVMFASKVLDFGGAGPFGCLILGFVAAIRWKLDSETFLIVEGCISTVWQGLEPFLFSLIGCEVTLSSLRRDIGSSILVLSIGIIFRVVTALIATVGGNICWKEKVFVAFAWLPKATVQAAVGPQALDYVLVNNKGPEMEEYAQKVLAVAVLSILMTAPVGAILISLLGPLLLTQDGNETEVDKALESLPLEDLSHARSKD